MTLFRLKTAMWLVALFQKYSSTNRQSFCPRLKNPGPCYSHPFRTIVFVFVHGKGRTSKKRIFSYKRTLKVLFMDNEYNEHILASLQWDDELCLQSHQQDSLGFSIMNFLLLPSFTHLQNKIWKVFKALFIYKNNLYWPSNDVI